MTDQQKQTLSALEQKGFVPKPIHNGSIKTFYPGPDCSIYDKVVSIWPTGEVNGKKLDKFIKDFEVNCQRQAQWNKYVESLRKQPANDLFCPYCGQCTRRAGDLTMNAESPDWIFIQDKATSLWHAKCLTRQDWVNRTFISAQEAKQYVAELPNPQPMNRLIAFIRFLSEPSPLWAIFAPFVAFVALCCVLWCWREHSHFVYECKHEVMMKELAEVRGWYFGEHGETLLTEQYDWAYNEASDALRDLGNATSK